MTFLHDLEKLGNVQFKESKILIRGTDRELVDRTKMQQIYDQAVVFVVFHSNEDYSSDIGTDSNASIGTLTLILVTMMTSQVLKLSLCAVDCP